MSILNKLPLLFLLIVIFGALVGLKGETSNSEPLRRYSLGIVPQYDQRYLLDAWAPIVDALSKKMGIHIEIETAHSIESFTNSLLNGDFDFAYANPYQALRAYRAKEYRPLLRSEGNKLQGVLIVPNDCDAKTVSDLSGQKIIFPPPSAFGASILLQAELEKFDNFDFKPVYADTHSSVYLYVAKKIYPAGGGVKTSLQNQKTELLRKVKILYETMEVNSHPIVVHPRVSAETNTAFLRSFIELEQSEPELFLKISFEMPIAASIQDYHPLFELVSEPESTVRAYEH